MSYYKGGNVFYVFQIAYFNKQCFITAITSFNTIPYNNSSNSRNDIMFHTADRLKFRRSINGLIYRQSERSDYA